MEFTLNIQLVKCTLVFYFSSLWCSSCYNSWNITILEFWKAKENGKTTGSFTVDRWALTCLCPPFFSDCSRKNCIVHWTNVCCMLKGMCSHGIGIRDCVTSKFGFPRWQTGEKKKLGPFITLAISILFSLLPLKKVLQLLQIKDGTPPNVHFSCT